LRIVSKTILINYIYIKAIKKYFVDFVSVFNNLLHYQLPVRQIKLVKKKIATVKYININWQK